MGLRDIYRSAAACLLLAAVGWAGATPGESVSASRQVHAYTGRDGRILGTNRPQKYQLNPDYKPLNLKTISVEKRYALPEDKLDTATKAEIISHYARYYRLNENLVYAVIKIESNFDPHAVSSAGARGLMQLMPGTAAEMGVTDIFDVAQNIAGGTQYLAKMLELFDGDISLALAGYNAGPGAVQKYNGIPPYAETQAYVKRGKEKLKEFQFGGQTKKLENLARIDASASMPILALKLAKPETRDYVVHFNSGLTQPADKVEDKDPYWIIYFGNRSYEIRKDMVKEIEKSK